MIKHKPLSIFPALSPDSILSLYIHVLGIKKQLFHHIKFLLLNCRKCIVTNTRVHRWKSNNSFQNRHSFSDRKKKGILTVNFFKLWSARLPVILKITFSFIIFEHSDSKKYLWTFIKRLEILQNRTKIHFWCISRRLINDQWDVLQMFEDDRFL